MVCLLTVFAFQYFGKGNLFVNMFVITLHVFGDVMMIMSLTKYSWGQKKSGAVYMAASSSFFVLVGLIAVLQSTENKNWQYFLGTAPFFVANIYQIMDAWEIKGKELFNYKLTAFIAGILAYLYYQMDLVYSYTWIQILGYTLFPVFLGMTDSPKVYLGRIMSVALLLLGAFIDIIIQFSSPGVVPAAALSAFFITLIAFFGFKRNAHRYIEKVDEKDFRTLRILKLLSST